MYKNSKIKPTKGFLATSDSSRVLTKKSVMKTTVVIPEALLDEAKAVSGLKTKTHAIVLALEEFIQRRKAKRILELKGSLKGQMDAEYDYKKLRQKR